MRQAAFVLAALLVIATASPAHAQLGALGKIKKGADKAVEGKQKVDEFTFSDAEEKQIGEQVSQKLRDRFGVYQNEAVTKYVSLVGSALAQSSTRPTLEWSFIVLDTDGVNAYAAPGGYIHITKGLLGLMKNESELAGVLGHEITHVTKKHTIEAIRRSKLTNEVTQAAGGGSLRNQIIARVAGLSYERIFDGSYSRDDENESDKIGVQVANKVATCRTGLPIRCRRCRTAMRRAPSRTASSSRTR
jgi:predicted Zn-dependent protease